MTTDNVRFKIVDGEVYLNAEDLQAAISLQSKGVGAELRKSYAYETAKQAEMVFNAVVETIGKYRTKALAKVVRDKAKNDFIDTIIDKLLFRD